MSRPVDPAPGNVVWEPLEPADLPRLDAIARAVHPSLPERLEVLAEKRALFRDGALKLVGANGMVGYGLSHPWTLNVVPPLDAFLCALPSQPDCLYLHDIAVLPEARGQSAAERYLDLIRPLALRFGLAALACVSVYGTHRLWRRLGFHDVRAPAIDDALGIYGTEATYMVADVPR